MKEVTRLLIYTVGSLAVIWLLIELAGRDHLSGYALLPLALVLVVIAPIAAGIAMARRERTRRAAEGTDHGRDAGKP
jgi:hypothetical protein